MGNKCNSIKVEGAFQVSNGLSGMNRDVILRLCILLGRRDKSIRSIFGISQEYVLWKNHHRFENHRKTNITVSLLRNPKDGCVVCDGPSGIHCSCTFTSPFVERTVFIDHTLSEGIFKWTIQVAYNKMSKDVINYFYLGAAMGNLLKQWSEQCLGFLKGSASVSFFFGIDRQHKRDVSGIFGWEGPAYIAMEVADGSLVSLEADCAASAVTFFVDGRKLPYAVGGVRAPLHLGVSGWTNGGEISFASISFRRLSSATPSTIVCKMYKARIKG